MSSGSMVTVADPHDEVRFLIALVGSRFDSGATQTRPYSSADRVVRFERIGRRFESF